MYNYCMINRNANQSDYESMERHYITKRCAYTLGAQTTNLLTQLIPPINCTHREHGAVGTSILIGQMVLIRYYNSYAPSKTLSFLSYQLSQVRRMPHLNKVKSCVPVDAWRTFLCYWPSTEKLVRFLPVITSFHTFTLNTAVHGEKVLLASLGISTWNSCSFAGE